VDTLETGTTLVVLSRSDIVLGGSTIGTTAVAEDSIVPGGAVLRGWCSSMLDAIRLFVRNGNRRPIVAPTAAQDRTIATAPYVETGKRPRAAKECLGACKFIAAVPPERSEGKELAEGCPQARSQPHFWEMLHGLIRYLHCS